MPPKNKAPHLLVIDRFEGGYAVAEDENRETRNILRGLLPPEAREGDVLAPLPGGRFAVDREATSLRREKIGRAFGGLFEK